MSQLDTKNTSRPALRLVVLGPPKSGKTTYLKHLAEQFGSWIEDEIPEVGSKSTAKLQTSQCLFSLREVPQHQAFEVVNQKHFLLDGCVLVCDLSQPIRAELLEIIRFSVLAKVPLRMVIATHHDAFEGDQDLIDACELSLRESLATTGAEIDGVPIVHSSPSDFRGQECIDRLHSVDWGPPLSEKPFFMWVTKSKDVSRSVSSAQIKLLRGSVQPGAMLEAFCFGQRKIRGKILQCTQNNEEKTSLRALTEGTIQIDGVLPNVGAVLAEPGQFKTSVKATAQLYLFEEVPGELHSRPILQQLSIRIWNDLSYSETASVVFNKEVKELRSDRLYEVKISIGEGSPNFLYEGFSFWWSYNFVRGGGVIVGLR